MKAYVVTTGLVFVLIVAAHIARLIADGPDALREPSFILTSILAVALAAWAGSIYRQLAQNTPEKT